MDSKRDVTGEIVQAAHDAVDAQHAGERTYRVVWTLTVPAASALDAALFAQSVMRNPDAVASRFEITDEDGRYVVIDLDRD